MQGISVTGLVKRGWMVLVAVAVVAVAGFSVYRLHGI
ncbi:MmpS family transport accessory protein, partial [Mycobacterium tuberculosis]